MKAVLFDWGETLVAVPGMVHSAERHIECIERLYFERAKNGLRSLQTYGVAWPRFRAAYVEAAHRHIASSRRTRREHRFEDRFASALQLAGAKEPPRPADLVQWVARLGELIVAEAALVDGAAETVPRLARRARLGIVSNYPYAPVVVGTLERFGLRRYFATIVVSGELGWLKPHPDVYRFALQRIGADAQETWFVGDDLENDVRGPKALGLHTVWLAEGRRAGHPEADLTLSDLRELAQRLELTMRDQRP